MLVERLSSHRQTIDVLYGRCNGFEKPFICLNASTMGIGGETAGRVAAQGKFMRNFSGEFRFVFAAVGALAAWRERRVIVTVDGRTIVDRPMNLVAVANGLYCGGGMMLSPDAQIDDGKLGCDHGFRSVARECGYRTLTRSHRRSRKQPEGHHHSRQNRTHRDANDAGCDAVRG